MKWVSLLLVILLALPASAVGWYNPLWLFRQKVTVQSGQVDADLTDFPVYVDLTDMASGFTTNVKTGGVDIRITKTDGTTEIPREIVFFDGVNGELHFKASGTLSSSVDTDYYLYYGNSAASDYALSATYGAENVWNSNYVAVWHNQEEAGGTAPQILDSTNYDHDMTTAGSMTNGDNIAGQLSGFSLDFDGSDDYLTVADSDALDAKYSQTISAWISTTNAINGRPVISKLASGAGTDGGWAFNMRSSGSVQYLAYNGTSATTSAIATRVINDGGWYLIHGVQTGGTRADMYINGVSNGSDTSTSGISAGTHLVNQASRGDSGTKLDAKIDEVRIMSTNMTATWISTEFNNQNGASAFYTAAAEEEAPAVVSDHTLQFGQVF